jgi:BNR repeat protein
MRTRDSAILFSLILSLVLITPVQAAPAFSNTLLLSTFTPPAGLSTSPNVNSTGNSEPAIAIGGPSNTMVVDGLAWLPFQVNLWKGQFGDTPPATFGAMDTTVPSKGAGRIGLGDGDADVEITSAGTILLADLDFFVNKPFNNAQLGVSVTRCPASATSPAGCSTSTLDQSGADRPWITVNGTRAWLSYHDAGSSSIIHVLRSSDDGVSWQKAGDPIVGQAGATGGATFNNVQGPLVADPHSGNVYDVYAAGEASVQKGTTADFNNIYVSRSTDGGQTWTANLVDHAPRGAALNNIFPALAVDPSNGSLYAVWSDQHTVWVSVSADGGSHWTAPSGVSTAATVVMPWVAARNGKVDVVYYGTSAGSVDDTNADWFVYDSQRTGSWTVKTVSNSSNRHGAVCLGGSGCTADRQLLDLFEVVENPANGKAAVIYTDTTIDTYSDSSGTHELPEIVIAYEK